MRLENGKYIYDHSIWSQPLYEIFNQFDKKGFWCGGHAKFLCDVYKLFNYQADYFNYGYLGNGATHVFTVVDYGYGYYIQDCLINGVSLNSYDDIKNIISTYDKCGLDSIFYISYKNDKKRIIGNINPLNYQYPLISSMDDGIYNVIGIRDFRGLLLHQIIAV